MKNASIENLTELQKKSIGKIIDKNSQYLFVEGAIGSGKTYIAHALKHKYLKNNKNPVIINHSHYFDILNSWIPKLVESQNLEVDDVVRGYPDIIAEKMEINDEEWIKKEMAKADIWIWDDFDMFCESVCETENGRKVLDIFLDRGKEKKIIFFSLHSVGVLPNISQQQRDLIFSKSASCNIGHESLRKKAKMVTTFKDEFITKD